MEKQENLSLNILGGQVGTQAVTIAQLQAENMQLKQANSDLKKMVADLGGKEVSDNEHTQSGVTDRQE